MSITGLRLKERRKSIEMSADEVASELGVSRSTIFRYESGHIEKVPANVIEELASILKTTPAYLMGWTDDPDDWEQIANDSGISAPNDWDGNPKDWCNMKIHAAGDYEREENELIKSFINDSHFEELASSYVLLNASNKDRVTNYAEKLLDIQRLEEQSHITQLPQEDKSYLAPVAAHKRTDIADEDITDKMKQHDMDIMNNDDFWK